MINDLSFILNWWFLLFGLGAILFPLTQLLFKNFFDLGYAFSKIAAVLLLSYLVWLFGSLKILPFSVPTIWFFIFALTLASFFILKKQKKEFLSQVKKRWKILLFEEFLFFSAFTFWSFVRGFQPDIEGLEKFMDFGFVNSILRGQYFPPADMWMAGKTINYYYFGHLVAAVLTKLSGIDSSITYNLMIATIFGLAFSATFSLGTNLMKTISHSATVSSKKVVAAGLISAFLLTLGGNLHPLWWFLTHNLSLGNNFAGYWYPDATRFIVEKFGAADNTIHEFPIYSFVVSDLHGHVSDIPFVLLFLGLIFSLILKIKLNPNHSPYSLLYLLPLSLSLAVMYMTNSWDLPIYFLILGLALLWLNYQKYGLKFLTFYKTFLLSASCLLLAIVFSLPFHLHFSQIGQGIGFVHARSPFWQLLVLWGFPWFVALSFIAFLVGKLKKQKDQLPTSDIYILIFILVATFLILVPEIVYLKDIYIASYHRANTMFKLVYQSFMLYAVASGYILIRISTAMKHRWLKFLLVACYLSLFAFVAVYPYFAVSSYYGNFKNYHGLYGLNFLKREPNDLTAINWLKQNIAGQPVVLEAAGDSYTDYSRVSAMTGLPTVEGWLVHEWLWRGGFDEPGQRNTEVTAIFESKDLNLTKNLLRKYDVQYLFIGSKEREKYQVFEQKFNQWGKIVFSEGNTKIYLLEKLNTQ